MPDDLVSFKLPTQTFNPPPSYHGYSTRPGWFVRRGFTSGNAIVIASFMACEMAILLIGMPYMVKVLSATIYFIVYLLTSAILGRTSTYLGNKILGRVGVVSDPFISRKQVLSLSQGGWIRAENVKQLKVEGFIKTDFATSLASDAVRNVIFLGSQFIILLLIWQVTSMFFTVVS